MAQSGLLFHRDANMPLEDAMRMAIRYGARLSGESSQALKRDGALQSVLYSRARQLVGMSRPLRVAVGTVVMSADRAQHWEHMAARSALPYCGIGGSGLSVKLDHGKVHEVERGH